MGGGEYDENEPAIEDDMGEPESVD